MCVSVFDSISQKREIERKELINFMASGIKCLRPRGEIHFNKFSLFVCAGPFVSISRMTKYSPRAPFSLAPPSSFARSRFYALAGSKNYCRDTYKMWADEQNVSGQNSKILKWGCRSCGRKKKS